MNIAIIGAGSIGLLFASYLSRTFSINLYTRSAEQAAEINQNGLLLLKETKITKSHITAFPISKWTGSENFTIITVKQYQLLEILDRIDHSIDKPESLLFIQNGMGHLKFLVELKVNNIFVGSVEHGANRLNAYTVSHNGNGPINAAVYKGKPKKLHDFAERITSDFKLTLKPDYYEMLLKKLIANAVINPLTAILQIKNGELLENPFYYSLVKNLFNEISSILDLKNPDGYFLNIVNICEKTADNRSSMLKDVESGGRTEVDAILGYILDEADRKGKKAVLVESYYLLLKGKEARLGGA
nr:2-dehydropantoate 2-reductase [Neobacillus sp. Marseille-Q6967]